jgi:hypothetical protein
MYKPQSHIQQLAEHIEKNLNKGYTLDSLRFSLMNQGYSRISVDKAIEMANKQIAEKIPPIKEKPQIIYRTITPEGNKTEIIQMPIKKKNWLKRIFNK